MLLNQSTLTIVVLILVVLLYASEKIPLALTAVLSMLAMYFTGVLTFSEAFSGFANNAVIMIIGMGIFGHALMATGLIEGFVQMLSRLFLGGKGFSERGFLLVGGAIAAAMSVVINPMLTTSIFMSIIDAIARQPGSKITRKNTYLPIAIATIYGAMCTSISSTTIIATSNLLSESAVGRPFTFFEPAVVGIPCVIVYLLFFPTLGHRLEEKCFQFDDLPSDSEGFQAKTADTSPIKRYITIATLGICVLLFIFSDFSLGAVALAGGAVLMLTGCVETGAAIKSLNWSTIILVASSIGFAKGVDVSGAGETIANFIIDLCGPMAQTGFGVCIIALIVSSLLSNFMNNSSTALILVPIFIIIGENIGAPLVPVAIASGACVNLATATPVCTANITITASAGYRFRDYLCVGGAINLICVLVCAVALYLVYFI